MNKNRLYDWIAGILSAAVVSLFGLILNANTYLHKVDDNTKNIIDNTTEIKKIKREFYEEVKLMRKEATENNIKVLKGVNELKVELQNKQNRP